MEALKPFAVDNYKQDPEPLQYLRHKAKYTFDVAVTVSVAPQNSAPTVVSQSNFKYMYWTMKQQLVHHSISGHILPSNSTPQIT